MAEHAPRPTEAETAILSVLWARGPSTVRQVHHALAARGTGYTTVLKLMQIMQRKGLLVRDAAPRSHVYAPAVDREAMQRRWLDELVDRGFAGSTVALVTRALTSRPASPQELVEIRALVDRLAQARAEPSRSPSTTDGDA